jgi:hypothetical protein
MKSTVQLLWYCKASSLSPNLSQCKVHVSTYSKKKIPLPGHDPYAVPLPPKRNPHCSWKFLICLLVNLTTQQRAIRTRNMTTKEVPVYLIFLHTSGTRSQNKVKAKFAPEQAMKAHMGRRDIALLFFNLGTRREVGGQRRDPASLPRRKKLGAHCTGGWVGHRAGLDGCGKSRPPPPAGIRSPGRPAHTEWLYRLSHPGQV